MQQQSNPNGQITRTEYEARHAAIVAQIAQNEARLFAEQAATKADMERKFDRLLNTLDDLRRDLVNKDVLKPQIDAMEARLKALEQEQISRTERFWVRFGPLIALGMFIITLLEILSKGHLIP